MLNNKLVIFFIQEKKPQRISYTMYDKKCYVSNLKSKWIFFLCDMIKENHSFLDYNAKYELINTSH